MLGEALRGIDNNRMGVNNYVCGVCLEKRCEEFIITEFY